MRRFDLAVVAAAVCATLLAGCGGDPVKDASQDVEFVPCSEAECSGTLPSGAEFDILLPDDWSGSLALFSHGLRGPGTAASAAASASPSASPDADGRNSSTPSPTGPQPRPGGPEPAPLWAAGDNAIADVMLQAGYAVAGATPPEEGWSVGAQIVAAEELHQHFVDNVAEPNRVYAWGESTGGLTSVRLAELHPDWVSGAAALCAPMSGPVPTFDLALDVGFAVRQLLAPRLKLVEFDSLADAQRVRDVAVESVRAAASSGAEGQAAVLFIAGIANLPSKSRTESGDTLASQVAASVDGITNLLEQNTVQRYQLEQLVGGNPSGNEGSDYRLRISDARRADINTVYPNATSKFYAQLLKGPRIAPDEEATRAAAAQGELVGNLEVPVLTLHNAFDPVYIAQNESWYRERVGTHGVETAARLVNAYVQPPGFFSATDPAGEGAGNCNFEPRTVIGVLIQLNDWVRNGQYPGRDSLAKAFAGPQVTLDYDPGPWPAMAVSPLDPPLEPDPDSVYKPSASASPSETSGSASPSASNESGKDGSKGDKTDTKKNGNRD